VAEGDGPVNALDAALRKGLSRDYPQLERVHLRDFKVRVVNPTAESAAKVRVIVEFAVLNDGATPGTAPGTPPGSATSAAKGESLEGEYFATVGVNENVVDASWQALTDAFVYYLIESKAKPAS